MNFKNLFLLVSFLFSSLLWGHSEKEELNNETEDFLNKLPSYEARCEAGEIFDCYFLGSIYDAGMGVKQDYGKAKIFYEKACNADNADYVESCQKLGDLYGAGQGVKQDLSKAKTLYEKACNADYANSCERLASLHKESEKKQIYYLKAAKIYEEKCNSGNTLLGCYPLAVLYVKGYGVKQDYEKAASLYEKACNTKGVNCDNLEEVLKELRKKK